MLKRESPVIGIVLQEILDGCNDCGSKMSPGAGCNAHASLIDHIIVAPNKWIDEKTGKLKGTVEDMTKLANETEL